MSRRHRKLDSRKWEAARRAAFERDGYRCRLCGKAGRLEGHHEPPLREGADPYDVAGILTLCRGCHIKRHRPDDMVEGRAAWLDEVERITSEAPPG